MIKCMVSKIFAVTFIYVIILSWSASAHAGATYLDFRSIYMTSGEGTYDVRTSYAWDETPWLYLEIEPVYGVVDAEQVNSWWYGNFSETLAQEYFPSPVTEIWIAPWRWNSKKTAGI